MQKSSRGRGSKSNAVLRAAKERAMQQIATRVAAQDAALNESASKEAREAKRREAAAFIAEADAPLVYENGTVVHVACPSRRTVVHDLVWQFIRRRRQPVSTQQIYQHVLDEYGSVNLRTVQRVTERLCEQRKVISISTGRDYRGKPLNTGWYVIYQHASIWDGNLTDLIEMVELDNGQGYAS